MTGTVMNIRHNKLPRQQTLGLDKCTKDALADYCRRRWPSSAAKLAAREWDLSLGEAQGVIAARASQTTIDKVFKRGGLLLALQVLEDVTGERLADILNDIRGLHEESAFRLGAGVRGPWSDAAAGGPDAAAGGRGLREVATGRRRRLG